MLVARSVNASGIERLLIVTVCVLVPRFAPDRIEELQHDRLRRLGDDVLVIVIGMFCVVVPEGKFSTPFGEREVVAAARRRAAAHAIAHR